MVGLSNMANWQCNQFYDSNDFVWGLAALLDMKPDYPGLTRMRCEEKCLLSNCRKFATLHPTSKRRENKGPNIVSHHTLPSQL